MFEQVKKVNREEKLKRENFFGFRQLLAAVSVHLILFIFSKNKIPLWSAQIHFLTLAFNRN
jgi:hypothetical protein